MTGMAVERDFRKLSLATQAELRRIAVAMVKAGKTRVEAAETVGGNRRFVGHWVKAVRAGKEGVWRSLSAGVCPVGWGLFLALGPRRGGGAKKKTRTDRDSH